MRTYEDLKKELNSIWIGVNEETQYIAVNEADYDLLEAATGYNGRGHQFYGIALVLEPGIDKPTVKNKL